MPTFQDTAPGAKSSKFTNGLNNNIFTPFLAQPGDLDGNGNDNAASESMLSAGLDQRLRIQEQQQQQSRGYGTNGFGQATNNNATNANANGYQTNTNHYSQPSMATTTTTTTTSSKKDQRKNNNNSDNDDNENGSDFEDSDFDDLLDDFDDNDPTLEAIRQRRLAELQKEHSQQQQQQDTNNKNTEYRMITQDEFLPECTSTEYAVVHFVHSDFERCKIMEYHLKRIASYHSSSSSPGKIFNCKFLGIFAEKAPFFVAKLQIKTLPTVIVFHNGKERERLIGFEGLVSASSKNPDEFSTSSLGRWIESTGAIEYEGPDSDDDDDENKNGGRSSRQKGGRGGGGGSIYQSRFHTYDEDD